MTSSVLPRVRQLTLSVGTEDISLYHYIDFYYLSSETILSKVVNFDITQMLIRFTEDLHFVQVMI